MSDLIDRGMVIDKLREAENHAFGSFYKGLIKAHKIIAGMPSAQPEPLTDAEQRIFLVAMERERKVCEKVDNQFEYKPDEPPLVGVCDEIKRKVKKVLWT